jgi:prepilin-type N-terminal cleavage/methylation domain-containing protein
MKKPAFTLIELLVVIVIIGILATIGISQFAKYNEKARLAKATHFDRLVDRTLMYNVENPLIGRWDMITGSGTTITDTSGNDNSLLLVNGAVWDTDTPNETGFSVHMPVTTSSPWPTIGNAGYQLNNITSLAGNDDKSFAIATWLKIESYPLTGYSTPISLITGTNTGGGMFLFPAGNGHVWARESLSEENLSASFSDSTFTIGRWHHVIIDVSSKGIRLFVDGDLVTESTPESDFDGVDINQTYYFNFGTASNSADFKIYRPRIYKSSIADMEAL